jgi:hypothetical protein
MTGSVWHNRVATIPRSVVVEAEFEKSSSDSMFPKRNLGGEN